MSANDSDLARTLIKVAVVAAWRETDSAQACAEMVIKNLRDLRIIHQMVEDSVDLSSMPADDARAYLERMRAE